MVEGRGSGIVVGIGGDDDEDMQVLHDAPIRGGGACRGMGFIAVGKRRDSLRVATAKARARRQMRGEVTENDGTPGNLEQPGERE